MKKIYSTLLFCFCSLVVLGQSYVTKEKGDWEVASSWLGSAVPPVSNIESDIDIVNYITRNGSLTFANNGGKDNSKRILVNDYLVVFGDMYFGADAIELVVGPNGKLVVFGDLTLQNKVTVANSGIVVATGNIRVNNSGHTTYENKGEGVTYSNTSSGQSSGSQHIETMPNSPNPTVREIYEFIRNVEGDLPVDLLYFNATEVQGGVNLEWASLKEWAFSHYVVERSVDGRNFEEVAEVQGEGESENINKYNLIDSRAVEGLNYYRLKALDTDGKFEYKGLEVVNVKAGSSIRVYPNPTTDGKITVQYGGGEAKRFSLLNGSGIEVYAGVLQLGQTKVELGHLPKGIYSLRLEGVAKASGARIVIQ